MKLSILSILITIITLFTVSYSSHLEQLMYDKLPSDDKFLINYNSLMFIEPMIEDWSPEWNYDIEQNKVRNELQSIYSITKQYCQSDSLNLELNLLMGLISHYAYGDSVEYYLTKAKT